MFEMKKALQFIDGVLFLYYFITNYDNSITLCMFVQRKT